jgi:hypothetical protein
MESSARFLPPLIPQIGPLRGFYSIESIHVKPRGIFDNISFTIRKFVVERGDKERYDDVHLQFCELSELASFLQHFRTTRFDSTYSHAGLKMLA